MTLFPLTVTCPSP